MIPESLEFEIRQLDGVLACSVGPAAITVLAGPTADAEALAANARSIAGILGVSLPVQIIGGIGADTSSTLARLKAPLIVGTATAGATVLLAAAVATALTGGLAWVPGVEAPSTNAPAPVAAAPQRPPAVAPHQNAGTAGGIGRQPRVRLAAPGGTGAPEASLLPAVPTGTVSEGATPSSASSSSNAPEAAPAVIHHAIVEPTPVPAATTSAALVPASATRPSVALVAAPVTRTPAPVTPATVSTPAASQPLFTPTLPTPVTTPAAPAATPSADLADLTARLSAMRTSMVAVQQHALEVATQASLAKTGAVDARSDLQSAATTVSRDAFRQNRDDLIDARDQADMVVHVATRTAAQAGETVQRIDAMMGRLSDTIVASQAEQLLLGN